MQSTARMIYIPTDSGYYTTFSAILPSFCLIAASILTASLSFFGLPTDNRLKSFTVSCNSELLIFASPKKKGCNNPLGLLASQWVNSSKLMDKRLIDQKN